MIYVGIDTGGSGAIAVYNSEDSTFKFFDMQTTIIKHDDDSHKSNMQTVAFLQSMYRFLQENVKPYTHVVYIERIMPFGKGSASTYLSQGRNIGAVYAVLSILGITFNEVLPRIWQKHLGLYGKSEDKKLDILKAVKEIYPQTQVGSSVFHTPRGRFLDGRSDAVGIMHYARSQVCEE